MKTIKRIAGVTALAGAIAGSLFTGATVAAGTAGADPWKCESCGYPFPKIPGPGDIPYWNDVPGWGNAIPWGHLPEGWH
ncbi:MULTISPECIES: hypothetical protein [unclassified Mycobacterium]|uniref:hypothetical protein n=1 Tax=unclassified Mycobacterium TaxID=2642494 RepID=UPI00073FF4EE|nr:MULTISPECIES: hypothetical protein [unclassified Mycobacterium]KUH79911.1 hypothetical protein AU185_13000 [Mycobacterium sp. GA-0227b]KUH80703.1 hypothetical protein AU187_02100 [Mycobacterium sp. IS-1556]KUH82473.1 hypothetical protein AU186_17275 [Mycobacterium sp. GA-1999]